MAPLRAPAIHFWHNLYLMNCDQFRQSRKLSRFQTVVLFCLVLSFHSSLRAEQQPRITFDFAFPGSEPDHYAISILRFPRPIALAFSIWQKEPITLKERSIRRSAGWLRPASRP